MTAPAVTTALASRRCPGSRSWNASAPIREAANNTTATGIGTSGQG